MVPLTDAEITYLELDIKYGTDALDKELLLRLVEEVKFLREELLIIPIGYTVSDLVEELEFLRDSGDSIQGKEEI